MLKNSNSSLRLTFISVLLMLMFAGLLARVIYLMFFDSEFLQQQGDSRSIRFIDIPAYRGMIVDRRGTPLAISVPMQSVWADPKDFSANNTQLKLLAKLLQLNPQDLNKKITAASKRDFVYLARNLDPNIAMQVLGLKIDGVHLLQEFKRFYPLGEASAQLVGLTNIDNQGQEGEELAYNAWLSGEIGKKKVLVDRRGNILADLTLIKPEKPGRDLNLSIDSRIQFAAYAALKSAINQFQAASGSVVVMDVNTGEVLAMANFPSYNPNNRPNIHDGRFRNRAVTDVFEPGSTVKSFSVANGLASGLYSPTTLIQTNPGYMPLGSHIIRDDDNYGLITVTQVLQKSSNIGVSKITLTLPDQSLRTLLHDVGYGSVTDSGFPGESSGYLPSYRKWNSFVLATLSFGYGLNITDLQLAQAYAMLAAGGIKHPVSLVKIDESPKSTRILPEKIAKSISTMLQTVIEEGGTATRAQVPGYKISGKTGTVRIIGPNGYLANHHTGIFVGFAPATKPRLVIAVVIQDPQKGGYYGGLVSAPVFAQVMSSALRILDIPPDDV